LESVNRYSILWQHPWSSLRRKTEENVLEPGRIEDKIREMTGLTLEVGSDIKRIIGGSY
jgi:hypothetical protein